MVDCCAARLLPKSLEDIHLCSLLHVLSSPPPSLHGARRYSTPSRFYKSHHCLMRATYCRLRRSAAYHGACAALICRCRPIAQHHTCKVIALSERYLPTRLSFDVRHVDQINVVFQHHVCSHQAPPFIPVRAPLHHTAHTPTTNIPAGSRHRPDVACTPHLRTADTLPDCRPVVCRLSPSSRHLLITPDRPDEPAGIPP